MARKKKPEIKAKDLQGYKYFKALVPVLEQLHSVGTERDKAGNRKLFYDHVASLQLLYFFNPILTSLRSIQQASELKKVQRVLGCSRSSLGSLSEAAQVFDAGVVQGVIAELVEKVKPLAPPKDLKGLENLSAVDGSLLPALPKMAWALWLNENNRAAKIHVSYEVLRGIPEKITVTEGNGSEKKQLRKMLEPGRLYVTDRGYAHYALFQAILDAGSSFICRIQDNSVWELIEEKAVGPEGEAAGVVRDLIVKIGGPQSGKPLKTEIRVVEVLTGKIKKDGSPERLLLATDRCDLEAELIAVGYRYRWSVELFFRWFKCILGCRHLLSQSENGLEIQVYMGIIASLLISLWTGRKPTKRTFEMICLHLSGWADEEELQAHIEKLQKHDS
jgi:hypothetical protein